MALDSHHRRVTCRWLHGRCADGRASSATSIRRVCSHRLRLCCLGLSFSWESLLGAVAAVAGDSRLVHRSRYSLLVWFTMTPMPPFAGANPASAFWPSLTFCSGSLISVVRRLCAPDPTERFLHALSLRSWRPWRESILISHAEAAKAAKVGSPSAAARPVVIAFLPIARAGDF